MNPIVKTYVISSLTTFISIFLVTLGGELSSGVTMQFTSATLFALIAVAGRAAVKAVVDSLVNKV